MRLVNYLNETGIVPNESFIEDTKKILHNCIPYIKDWQRLSRKFFLWRGSRTYGTSYGIYQPEIMTVRKDRNPRDTNRIWHKTFDEFFYKKFHIKARSECVFCQSDTYGLAEYGQPWIIVPCGNYKMIYSRTVEDLFSDVVDDIGGHWEALREAMNAKDDDAIDHWMEELMKEYEFYSLNNVGKGEIMLYCDKFVVFPHTWEILLNEIMREIKV